MMRIGIVGLPNSGKSTIFNALTGGNAPAESYPFCTLEPNIGDAIVPDERLDRIADIVHPPKVLYASIEFLDMPGLVKGASRGEGLGNLFLSHMRNSDAILHVLRCFHNEDIPHVMGDVNPVRDAEVVNMEIMLSDLEIVERRIEKVKRLAKFGDDKAKKDLETLEKISEILDQGLISQELSELSKTIEDLPLLSPKPTIYVANIGEEDLGKGVGNEIARRMGIPKERVVEVCGKLEAELREINPEERKELIKAFGMKEDTLKRVILACYELLDLVTFFTIVGKEARGWPVKRGTKAQEAAGKIHTDMEKGFIKAEVISYEQLLEAGSMASARDKGYIRVEGKDYEIRDGDIITFKFHV